MAEEKPPKTSANANKHLTKGGAQKLRFMPKVPKARIKKEEIDQSFFTEPVIKDIPRERPKFQPKTSIKNSKVHHASTASGPFSMGPGSVGSRSFNVNTLLGNSAATTKEEGLEFMNDTSQAILDEYKLADIEVREDEFTEHTENLLPSSEDSIMQAEVIESTNLAALLRSKECDINTEPTNFILFQIPKTSIFENDKNNKDNPVEKKVNQKGKLRVHYSGKITMIVNGIEHEIKSGTPSSFKQNIVARNKLDTMELGSVPHKVVCMPNIENLIKNMKIQ